MEKTDIRILIGIAIILISWGLFAVYQIASEYREPLEINSTDVKTHEPSYPDRFTCEGHSCGKL